MFVRQDGVNGLLELVNKYETLALLPHLSQVITGVAPAIFDTDSLIRTTAIKFVEALVMKVSLGLLLLQALLYNL